MEVSACQQRRQQRGNMKKADQCCKTGDTMEVSACQQRRQQRGKQHAPVQPENVRLSVSAIACVSTSPTTAAAQQAALTCVAWKLVSVISCRCMGQHIPSRWLHGTRMDLSGHVKVEEQLPVGGHVTWRSQMPQIEVAGEAQ
eukprot:1158592-Pelagomonas_calceolata.AAC.1